MNKVGIIIPTLNRLDFVQRLIKYYLFCNDQVSIYIGDASNDDSSNKLKSIIDNKSVCKIYYFHFPKLNDAKTIFKLSKLVKEKFICFSGDDDFFVPQSLIKCANFLQRNQNYRCVQGRAYIFETLNDKLYQKVIKIHNYWNKNEILERSAEARSIKLSKNYYVTEFSLHRTTEFIIDKEPSINILDRNIREYISSFSIILNGKSKFLDCLYLIRQHHPARGISNISNHYGEEKTNFFFDNHSIEIFKKFIESSLIKNDSLSLASSQIVVKKILQNLNIIENKSIDPLIVTKGINNFFKYLHLKISKTISIFTKQRFHNVKHRYKGEMNKFLFFIENDF